VPGADNGTLAKCEVDVGNNKTEQCTDWEYFGDIGHTIVSQVGLYNVHVTICRHVRYIPAVR